MSSEQDNWGSIIEYSLIWNVEPGKTDEFKQLVAEAVETARRESPVTEYKWYFNDDMTRCGLIERYPDSEALLAHLRIVGNLLSRMLAISKISRFDVLGKLQGKAREDVEKMGARIYLPFKGFRRDETGPAKDTLSGN